MMKSISTVTLVFVLVVSVLTVLPVAIAPAAAANNERIMVNLGKKDQRLFLTEMRAALAAIHNILLALDDSDMAAVAEAAQQSKSRIKSKSKELLKKLPPDFKIFSKAVRKGFKQIAKAANSGAGKDKVISLLGDQLGRCVACHATYRLR